jgi:hypothetical protein
MKSCLALTLVLFGVFCQVVHAQSLTTRRHIETATKETIPDAVKRIEEAVGVKVELTLANESLGDDEKAWNNFYLVCNRLVDAIAEVGKDQLGKDAIKAGVKKIAISKSTGDTADEVTVKEGTLTVKTAFTDDSIYTLQGLIQSTLEKSL